MIRVSVRDATNDAAVRPRTRRRRFGLDTALPADPWIVERAVLRHLEICRPEVLVLALSRDSDGPGHRADRVRLAAGVPDLLLVLPDGRLVFLLIKTQASDLSRAERAFADLCRVRNVPVQVVRSMPEARAALDRLGLPSRPESHDGVQESDIARRPDARSGQARP